MRTAPASKPRVVSATVAARGFGALVDRVRDEHAVYAIECRGIIVAHIAPAAPPTATIGDLARIFDASRRIAPDVLDAIDAATSELRALPVRATRSGRSRPKPHRAR